ncbi:ATP-binding protein [Dongia sedimenti]|uniref:histidine kinase n=1 Tax=Dongia sedimenti TaxID=3064282 RepID=A0ABU0YQY3_9PROT|nr:PAS domain-containing sensor histidine kinase [Rhodospirillaceae bacterium R-7]
MSIASLATPDQDSTARRRLRLLIGWVGALVLYVVLQFGMTDRGSFRAAALIDLAWTLASLAAAAQCYLTAKRLQGRERLAWLSFAGACLVWLIGQLYWDYLELALGRQTPFPSVSDLGYLGFPLLAIGGLLISIRRIEVRSGFLRPLSNLGMIAVALYTTLGMLLHDSLASSAQSVVFAVAAGAYPFLYGTAFLFALTALAIYSEPRKRAIALLQAGALGVLAIAAVNWGIGMLGTTYLPGTMAEPIWLCGFGLLHWAAWERKNQPVQTELVRTPESQTLWLEPALPMVALIAIFAAIATDSDGLQLAEVRGILLPGGILFAILLAGAEWVSRGAEAKLRRRAETALRALQVSEERLASILEIAPEAIVAADRDSRIELFNRGAEHVFGYSAAEVIGRPIEILLPERMRARLLPMDSRRTVGKLWATEFDAQQEMVGLRRDGSEFPAEASVFQLATDDELAFALILRDVTDRKRQERDLRHAKETAELANRAKSEFLANMSHELRTPLNAIIGFSQIINSRMFGADIDRYVDYAHDIHNSGKDLLKIINDILDLSKIEAGQMNLSDQAVDLDRVITGCIKVVAERAQRGRITIERNLPEAMPRLWADELRVKQMVNNLLTNAVKFTEPGGRVVISVRPSYTPNGVQDGVDIVVRDTGIGMDPSEIPIALSPFGQVDQGLARRHEGTGLGLPLVRRMIELHQGQLSLSSARGKGTTATLHFPANRVVAHELAS